MDRRWVALALAISACGGNELCDCDTRDGLAADAAEVDAWEPPAPELWPAGAGFPLKGDLHERLPDLAAGPWVSHVTADDRPGPGGLAAFGVGNGHVFGLIGYPEKGPLNTLHGLVGPTYERGAQFFGDYAVELADAQGATVPFVEQWVARDATDALVLTRGRAGDLEVDTVDLAPTERVECVLRLVTVRNAGTAALQATARVRAAGLHVAAAGAQLVETTEERALTTDFGADAAASGRTLAGPTVTLQPGQEWTCPLTHCAIEGTTPGAGWRPATDEALDWIEAKVRDAAATRQDGARLQIDTSDPLVTAFLNGMGATISTQTAATGAVCPMSQYTRTWARDNIGPMLYLLDMGDFDAAARLLDYVWGATLLAGDLQNSYDADLDLGALPAQPFWTAMEPLGVRVGAETPSYLVILYGLWWRATGDLERARERWGLLRRAMLGVRFDQDRLLPWTGDETFRAAMNAAFGLGLDVPHHELSFSLNSNILWLAAARHFVALAEALGEHDDAAVVTAIAAEMEQKAMPRYRLADGCYSALIDRATGATWPAPFEDASLTPTWAGWLDGDDPRAVANVDALVARLGVAPGVLQSPLDPKYVNFPLLPSEEGVFTGMKPGYTLAALTDVGHPDALAAFNELRRSLDAGGNADEYLVFTSQPDVPYPGLTLFYNEQGLEPSDYTAKLRPWEGGIDADAAFRYLTGWRPDVPAGRLAFRPHLPNGWRIAAFVGLRAGERRYALTLTAGRPGVTHVAIGMLPDPDLPAQDVTVSLRWDSVGSVTFQPVEPPWTPMAAARARPPDAEPTVIERYGRRSTVLPDVVLPADSSLAWEIVETGP